MAVHGEVLSVYRFGRPTKLTRRVIDQAWEYLSETATIAVNAGGLLPTKERLALKLGINRDTLQEWRKKSNDFSVICDTLDSMQADMLLQNGLVGRYNPVITKLMLSKHGYVEKSEVDSKLEMVQPILGGAVKLPIDETSQDAED